MSNKEAELEIGYGSGISGPTTPGDHHISVAARIAKRRREEQWQKGDHESPWPPHDDVLVTQRTEHGHSNTVALFINQSYPSEAGLKKAELRAKQFLAAPKMQEFLEWAMGMPPQIWDGLPLEVRTRWKELVKSLPR